MASYGSIIQSGKIHQGQGEYIVFHNQPDGCKEVSRETYELAYKILNDYSPTAIVLKGEGDVIEQCTNRYEIIKAKIKELDPSLEIVFIPRTLYELIFIRKCIREDVKNNRICYRLIPRYSSEKPIGEARESKCWHRYYFADEGKIEYNLSSEVVNIAFRLNRTIVKSCSPTLDGFSHDGLLSLCEKEISFLKHHRKTVDNNILRSHFPGPTTNFAAETSKGIVRPMGIRDENHAHIIRSALTIECSETAEHSFIIYRGGDFQNDLPYCRDDSDCSYSLSYGSGLFAGCLYDGGATAFHYMRNGKNAYALSVPFHHLFTSPFYIPPTNTVTQMFGEGEIFHVRSKAWKDFDVTNLEGMNIASGGKIRDHLKSDLPKDELIEQFQTYMKRAFKFFKY